jgi:hypothetical protein
MRYKGYVKGDVVVLQEPLSVPDGTEVAIFILSAKKEGRKEQDTLSVAQQSFGMMRADPALVRAVLAEDVYEA